MARTGKKITAVLAFAIVVAFVACSPSREERPRATPAPSVVVKDSDRELANVATQALGDREGTVLVIDPRNGRIRLVVNPRLAFEQAFPPGSAIKPFLALTAMRAGVLSNKTLHQCRGGYNRPGLELVCAHPRVDHAMTFAEALAYSCNDYFGTISERLNESAFIGGLRAFGFGERTGINRAEVPGSLSSVEWDARVALGDSSGFLTTPIQLLTAYAALLNGGKLFRPKMSEAEQFSPEVRATLTITSSQLAMIRAGLRGTTEFGTARDAGFDASTPAVYSKTGTSTTSSGFRTQGWFVAFSGQRELSVGVLVFLKRAHGSEGAVVAKPVLETALRHEEPIREIPADNLVKIRRVSEGKTVELPLEDYIRGVVAAEGSTESEPEALKALAVVSRTYARRNRGRHASDGYDFCSTTHCQRYVDTLGGSLVERAVAATAGEILRDSRGEPIDAYFHASCGGMTADIADLWGVSEPGYLHSVRDDFCVSDGALRWMDRISQKDLLGALRTDARTDVGRRLGNVIVTQRDGSGRAKWITLEGERRRVVRGWDFKIVVGRSLGWNLLKSSKFEVARTGTTYLFRGSGFGHGLGLCQSGAHVSARRGAGYRQILRHYFAGLPIGSDAAFHDEERVRISRATWAIQETGVHKTEFFVVKAPRSVMKSDLDRVVKTLESFRALMMPRLEAAGIRHTEGKPVEVVLTSTTEQFIRETGQPGWAAAATRDGTIVVQPVALLERRGVLDSTLRHEYAHIVLERLSQARGSRWMAEGLAVYFAGEAKNYAKAERLAISDEELDLRLARPKSRDEMRALYAESYGRVRELIKREGESVVLRKFVGVIQRS
jgi:stage II sporulation protein D